jgi:hypothetical protein
LTGNSDGSLLEWNIPSGEKKRKKIFFFIIGIKKIRINILDFIL